MRIHVSQVLAPQGNVVGAKSNVGRLRVRDDTSWGRRGRMAWGEEAEITPYHTTTHAASIGRAQTLPSFLVISNPSSLHSVRTRSSENTSYSRAWEYRCKGQSPRSGHDAERTREDDAHGAVNSSTKFPLPPFPTSNLAPTASTNCSSTLLHRAAFQRAQMNCPGFPVRACLGDVSAAELYWRRDIEHCNGHPDIRLASAPHSADSEESTRIEFAELASALLALWHRVGALGARSTMWASHERERPSRRLRETLATTSTAQARRSMRHSEQLPAEGIYPETTNSSRKTQVYAFARSGAHGASNPEDASIVEPLYWYKNGATGATSASKADAMPPTTCWVQARAPWASAHAAGGDDGDSASRGVERSAPDAASVGRGCRAVMESARAAADECGVSANAERRYRAVWISAIPSIPVRPMQSTHPTIRPQRERLYPSALFSSNSGEEQPKQALTGQDVSLEHPSEEVHQREVYAMSIRSGWNVESSVALTRHASNAATKQGSRE
ncbi:hypothetical protein B0H14DRAFT_3446139 [Mycena olivaceomarginata]|nr:hypothetical protein B0H14DRAFT_3446139 [Mycena olivaceomarginata]